LSFSAITAVIVEFTTTGKAGRAVPVRRMRTLDGSKKGATITATIMTAWDLREIYRLAGLSDVKSDVKCDAEFFGR
jgi:hypothetical protein